MAGALTVVLSAISLQAMALSPNQGAILRAMPTGNGPGYLEPFIGLNYIQQNSNDFAERGGHDRRAKQEYSLAGRKLVLKGHVIWRRLNGDLRPEMRLAGCALPRAVRAIATHSYLVEIKADYFLTPLVVLDLDYNGSFGGRREGQRIAFNAHLKLSFPARMPAHAGNFARYSRLPLADSR